jgi:hypothetical protein
MSGQAVIPGTVVPSWSTAMTTSELLTAITAELSAIGAATHLGLISQEGERASTVLMIDERRFCLTIEPAPADMLPDARPLQH